MSAHQESAGAPTPSVATSSTATAAPGGRTAGRVTAATAWRRASASDVTQLRPAHQLALDLFERDTFGLGNQSVGEEQKHDVERRVEPEGLRPAKVVEQREERRVHDHVGGPV